MSCEFSWKAPHILPPRYVGGPNPIEQVWQQCSLPRGHDGLHRTLAGVVPAPWQVDDYDHRAYDSKLSKPEER